MSRIVDITLLSKPGCHLCDEARETIERVREVVQQSGIATALDEINILDDEKLARLHSEDIPVVLVSGKQHAIWRVDETRLTRALEKAARGGLFSRNTSRAE